VSWLTAVPFAHRGLHDRDGRRPENSLAAFAAAMERGLGIELDVRASADGAAMVFHDATLERLTAVRGSLRRHSGAALRALRLNGSDERIPLLGEVLKLVDGRVPVLIEVKTSGPAGGVGRAVARALARYSGPFAVMSFSPLVLAWFRLRCPALRRGVVGGDTRAAGRARIADAVALSRPFLRWLGPTFVAYDVRALPCARARRIRRLGLPLLAWTVTDATERACAARHADNMIFEAAGAPVAWGGAP